MENIDQVNYKSYNNRRRARIWASFNRLQPGEQAILQNIGEKLRYKRILDIGVGGGRTTPYLLEISSDYTAIDYSPAMVSAVKKKYPGLNIFHRDARDMRIFKDGEFDFILFSFNGIDYVTHDDRILIMKEIYRILKRDGYFMFSTHNRDAKTFNNYKITLKLSPNPLKMARLAASFLLAHLNRRKNKKKEIYTDEYAIVNDPGHTYSLMTYFISIDRQIRQLENIGFIATEIFNKRGERVASDSESDWIHYLSRK